MSIADDIIYGKTSDLTPWIESDIDLDGIDEYGFTPLVETIIVNKPDMTRLLLQRRVDVNVPDTTGRSALHWAVDNHNIPLCELLLKYKADPNAYTFAAEPVLVNPLLRRQKALKELLLRHGADLNFALDFINTKLLGHRFELKGKIDIISPKGRFIELDFEGFFLEFTLELIQHSLNRFVNNYAARRLRAYFPYVAKIIHSLAMAAELVKYQKYTVDIKQHMDKIERLLDTSPLIIPMGYAGHAITFIYYGSLLAKCDRGEMAHQHGSVVVYEIGNRHRFNKEFIRNMLYKKQRREFVEKEIYDLLNLKPVTQLPLSSQIVGNCSWANVEAVIPTTLFLQLYLLKRPKNMDELIAVKNHALGFFSQWREWDKDNALNECTKSFATANRARKASKAAILGAVLFQTCDFRDPKHLARAEKILPYLMLRDYDYILRSYIDVYYREKPTPAGTNLMHLLDMAGFVMD